MIPLFALSVAHAGPTVAYVRGAGNVRAMALLIQRDGSVDAVRCHDGGDEPADGDWACGPLPPVTGASRVGLVRDGRMLDGGELTLDGGALFVDVRGGALVLGADPFAGAASPTAANPGLPTLLARVVGFSDGAAPVLRLQGPAGSAEIWCRDDGVFPDRTRNDGEQGCAGPAPGGVVPGGWGAELFLNAADGSSRSFGVVRWNASAPTGFATVDATKGTIDPAPFAIPELAPDAKLESEAPVPIPVAPETPTPPAPPEPAPPEPAPPQTPQPPEEKPGAPVDARAPVASRGISPLALVIAALVGAAGAFALRWRSSRLPANLLLHPSPALYDGGPSGSDPAAWVQAPDPAAAARALLPLLATIRRVVFVVGPIELPAVPYGPVYRCDASDCEAIEAAVRAIAATPGPPVSVLLVHEALTDAGAVAPDPARRLRAGLPPGVNMLVTGSSPCAEGFSAYPPPPAASA